MFRLYSDTTKFPNYDNNFKITLIVGLTGLVKRSKLAKQEMIEKLKEYNENKSYVLLMPSMKDKYMENIDTIHKVRELLDSVESEYIQLIEDFNVEIDNYNFIITPLYTNFNTFGCSAKHKMLIKKLHPDFSNAIYLQRNLETTLITPDNIINDFNYSYDYLKKHIKKDKQNIIFTIWNPMKVNEDNETLSAYSSNSLKEFIRENNIELWISNNNPSYSDYKFINTLIYNLERNKEQRYDYDNQAKVLYLINEVKRTKND